MTPERRRLLWVAAWIVPGLLASGACGPADLPSTTEGPESWFSERSNQLGVSFEYDSGHDGETYWMPEIMGGGAALFDLGGDGDLDLYLVQGGKLGDQRARRPPNRLFEQGDEDDWTDITRGSGAEEHGYGMGVACGDVNGDGAVDLYVTNLDANTLLLQLPTHAEAPRSAARFAAAPDAAHPGWSASAAFLDQDADGDLDLYVTNYLAWTADGELPCRNNLSLPDYCSPKIYDLPTRDIFYVNTGDGRLVDGSRESGVADALGTGLGVGCGDLDDDGWTDVFVANDGMPDFLWRNLGNGRFEEIGELAGCAVDANGVHKAGMGVTLGDVDDDDDLDLLVCNLNRESDSFYLNEGGFFRDRTARAGLSAPSKPFTRFGLGWVDFDLDGRYDLFQANGRVNRQGSLHDPADPYAEPNLLFAGQAGGHYAEVLPRGGTTKPLVETSRAAAFGDVDDDGDVDVIVVNRDGPLHWLENRIGNGRTSVTLDVRERSGAPAIGATVRVLIGGRPVRRDVRAAYSYLASNDPRLHVALGDATGMTDVVVSWVDGTRESFGPRDAGSHVLERGTGAPLPAEADSADGR